MSTPIVEVSTFSASVVVPVAGEAVTAASLTVAAQSLTNRTKWLNDNKLLKSLFFGKRVVPLVPRKVPTNWDFSEADPTVGWYQPTPNANVAWFPIPTPVVEGQITRLSMFINGSGGPGAIGHSALPASMPRLRLLQHTTDGNLSAVATANDGSANVAAYDQEHEVVITGLTGLDFGGSDDETNFWAEVRGESGSDSASNEWLLTLLTVTIAEK